MQFTDLRFAHVSYKSYPLEKDYDVEDESIFEIWPGMPERLLSGNSAEEIAKEVIDAIIEVFACSCLSYNIQNGCLILHCGGLDDEIQDVFSSFYLYNSNNGEKYIINLENTDGDEIISSD